MIGYQERLDKIDIVKSSPDGSVRVGMTGPGDVRVLVLPAAMDAHTERSLAGQAECTISAVVRGHDIARRRLIADVLAAAYPQPPTAEAADADAEIDSALARLEGTGRSPWGYVTLTWRGVRQVHMRLRSRTLRLLNAERLGDEMAAALAMARLRRHENQAGPIKSTIESKEV